MNSNIVTVYPNAPNEQINNSYRTTTASTAGDLDNRRYDQQGPSNISISVRDDDNSSDRITSGISNTIPTIITTREGLPSSDPLDQNYHLYSQQQQLLQQQLQQQYYYNSVPLPNEHKHLSGTSLRLSQSALSPISPLSTSATAASCYTPYASDRNSSQGVVPNTNTMQPNLPFDHNQNHQYYHHNPNHHHHEHHHHHPHFEVQEGTQSCKLVVATIHQDVNDVVNVAYSTDQPNVKQAAMLLNGQLPSNVAIDEAIANTRMSLSNLSDGMDAHGKKLARDVEDVLTSLQQLLHTRNSDEQLQKMFREAALFHRSTTENIGTLEEHDSRATVTDKRDVFANLKQVIIFTIKNSSFRDFIINYISIVRSILVGRIDEENAERLYRSVEIGHRARDPFDHHDNTTAHHGHIRTHPHNVPNPELEEHSIILSLEDRLQKLLVHLSKNPEYNQSVYNIMSIVDFCMKRLEQIDRNEMDRHNEYFSRMRKEALSLIASFTGKEKLNEFRNQFWNLFHLVRFDKECLAYFEDLKTFTLYCIEQSDRLTDDFLHRETTHLVKRGHALFDKSRVRYRESFDRLIGLAEDILSDLANDPIQLDFMHKMNKLLKDFVCDELGRPDIFVTQNSFEQVKRLVLPVIQHTLDNIPLPCIEGENETMSFSIQNMTLSGSDLLPDHMHLTLRNNINFKTSTAEPTSSDYQFHLSMDNIRMAFKGIKFRVKHKKFPKIEEYGTVDVRVEGDGLSMELCWSFLRFSKQPDQIKLDKVKCHMDRLVLNIRDAKRKYLDKLILSLFSNYIKRKIVEVLEEKIAGAIEPLNAQLNDFFKYQHETQQVKTKLNVALKKTYEAARQFDLEKVRQDLYHSVEEVEEIEEELMIPPSSIG